MKEKKKVEKAEIARMIEGFSSRTAVHMDTSGILPKYSTRERPAIPRGPRWLRNRFLWVRLRTSRLRARFNGIVVRYLDSSPNTPLWSTPIFKTAFLGLLSIASFLALVVGVNEWDRAMWVTEWDGAAYAEFLKIHTLPIGILGVMLAILALIAANHRSQQSAANLAAQQNQNIFSNYFRHLEEFERYCERLEPEYKFSSDTLSDTMARQLREPPNQASGWFSNYRVLHRIIYPGARSGRFEAGSWLAEQFRDLHYALNSAQSKLADELSVVGASSDQAQSVVELKSFLQTEVGREHLRKLRKACGPGIAVWVELHQEPLDKSALSPIGLFAELREDLLRFALILQFDHSESISELREGVHHIAEQLSTLLATDGIRIWSDSKLSDLYSSYAFRQDH